MRDMLGAGVDVMHRNPYLVNKINPPLSAISTIYVSVTMLVQLMLMVALFIIHVACGMQFDVYLLQVPPACSYNCRRRKGRRPQGDCSRAEGGCSLKVHFAYVAKPANKCVKVMRGVYAPRIFL